MFHLTRTKQGPWSAYLESMMLDEYIHRLDEPYEPGAPILIAPHRYLDNHSRPATTIRDAYSKEVTAPDHALYVVEGLLELGFIDESGALTLYEEESVFPASAIIKYPKPLVYEDYPHSVYHPIDFDQIDSTEALELMQAHHLYHPDPEGGQPYELDEHIETFGEYAFAERSDRVVDRHRLHLVYLVPDSDSLHTTPTEWATVRDPVRLMENWAYNAESLRKMFDKEEVDAGYAPAIRRVHAYKGGGFSCTN